MVRVAVLVVWGSIVIMLVEGDRPWWWIWDSTAYLVVYFVSYLFLFEGLFLS